jgi:glycosyltransferase involved in cell wall biosynthesis
MCALRDHSRLFERIVIYENDSSDDTPEILKALHQSGHIEYRHWPSGEHASPQISAYQDAAERCETPWLTFLDADEFLVLKTHTTVEALLDGLPSEVAGVAFNWRLFGSSGLAEKTDELVITRFTRASDIGHPINLHAKSCIRPRLLEEMHMHTPRVNGVYAHPDGSRFELQRVGFTPRVETTVAQVNHYFTKSKAEFDLKRSRGNANRGTNAADKYTRYTDAMFAWHDLNDEIDNSAASQAPDVESRMKVLASAVNLRKEPDTWPLRGSDLHR